MRMSPRVVVPFVLAAGAFAFAEDLAKVPVTVKLSKGAPIAFEQTTVVSTDATLPGGSPFHQSSDVRRAFSLAATAADPAGGGTVEAKFTRIHGKTTGFRGTVDFDSDKPPADGGGAGGSGGAAGGGAGGAGGLGGAPAGAGRVHTMLAGKTARATVARDGALGDISGIEGDAGGGGGGGGRGGDGGAGGAGGGGAGDRGRRGATTSGPAAARSCLQCVFVTVSQKPLGVGDTWTDDVAQEAMPGLKVRAAITYKVTAVDAETITVSINGKLSKADADAGGSAGGRGGEGDAGGEPGAGGGGREGRGGRGGNPITTIVRDAVLEQATLEGKATISRADGMSNVFETERTLVLKGVAGTPSAGSSVTHKEKVRIERKAAAPAPTVAPPSTK